MGAVGVNGAAMMANWGLRGMKRRTPKRPFLSRLANNTQGNVLVIVGVSLLPLLAMIGSGVDLTRAYMAQARLQQACDAAALAGRRVMSGGVVDKTVTDEASKFFNFNFPQGTWETSPFTPAITQGADATVVVNASTEIQTKLMPIFGFTTLPLNVNCDAKQDFVNTDIVLVLDTTGSMADTASSSDSDSKIVALRKAVMALYDELSTVQTKLEAAGLRLRYGVVPPEPAETAQPLLFHNLTLPANTPVFVVRESIGGEKIVPFSSGVNVGGIITGVNRSYMASDTWQYQSREVAVSAPGTISENTCTDRNRYNGIYNKTALTCHYFVLKQKTIDIANYVASKTVDVTPIVGGRDPIDTKPRPTVWEGCIEERQTDSGINASSGYTIPDAAKDLQIDLVPTADKATKWKPYWPEVEYRPDTGDQPQVACPVPAKRLKAWTRSEMSSYVDSLTPTGGTYHDNGMIWGARLLSQGGIFRNDNPTTFANMPVSRQIIYMTDGIIDTGPTLYSTYGLEKWDQRVTGTYVSEADQTSRHDQRFRMMCAATKQMGISIWVIAFASKLTTSLSTCATSTGQASTSANSAALTAKFVEIGKSIGALRLTK